LATADISAAAPPEERAGKAFEISRPVPLWGRMMLGTFLATAGVALLYSVIALWPTVEVVGTKAAGTKTITWFGWSYKPSADAALLVMVILVSALGSYVHAAVSFSDFVGNRRLASSWIWWYLLRIFVGSSLAVLFYFSIRGGLFGSPQSSDVNPYGFAALAGLVGLFSKQATDKLREIFDTAFRVAPGYGDDARGDSIVNPVPVLDSSEPPTLTKNDLEIVLVGSGFIDETGARVSQAGGIDVPRTVEVLSANRLKVSLEAGDVSVPGPLRFTVVNPEPGGGSSRTLEVTVGEEDVEEHGGQEGASTPPA
jgi:hypothetical protein